MMKIETKITIRYGTSLVEKRSAHWLATIIVSAVWVSATMV